MLRISILGICSFIKQVKFKKKLTKTITLKAIKKIHALKHLPLIKQGRLSVMPVDYKSWKIIYKMSNIN